MKIDHSPAGSRAGFEGPPGAGNFQAPLRYCPVSAGGYDCLDTFDDDGKASKIFALRSSFTADRSSKEKKMCSFFFFPLVMCVAKRLSSTNATF